MRILVVGTGGVGGAFAAVAARRDFFEQITLGDLDPGRPRSLVQRLRDARFRAVRVDASDEEGLVELIRAERADAVLNAAARASTGRSSPRPSPPAAPTSTWR